MTPAAPSLLVSEMCPEPLRRLLQPAEPALQRRVAIDSLRRVYRPEAGPGAVLERLRIRVTIEPSDMQQLPAAGPLIVVSNHPFGLLEAIALVDVLPKIRPDIRFLANSMLAEFPEVRSRCIFIDPFRNRAAIGRNASALRACLACLHGGGALAVFPAGKVAHFDWKAGAVADPAWNPAFARLGQISGDSVVPIFFDGCNGLSFQLAGAIHPRLRALSLPRELLKQSGWRIVARVGSPICSATFRSFTAEDATDYLRCRTYLLDTPRANGQAPLARHTAIAGAQPVHPIQREIEQLSPTAKLAVGGEFEVYCAASEAIPTALREIGRSFVQPEYQRQYAPAMLLWKGIALYAATRTECASLFGAVSISNSYHAVSRPLIVRFLQTHRMQAAAHIELLNPYRPDERLLHRTRYPRRTSADLETLPSLIAEMESDGKGVPVLLRQYLKAGGRLLAVNVDRRFSNALDAPIVVDLRQAPHAVLDRSMGKEQAATFRAWHAARA